MNRKIAIAAATDRMSVGMLTELSTGRSTAAPSQRTGTSVENRTWSANHTARFNVGDPALAGSHTVTMVDVGDRAVRAEIAVPGRTRWTVFDPDAATFYINIADPAVIVVIDSRQPDRIAHMFAAPAAGPHGLDLDTATRRLFCACDANTVRIMYSKPSPSCPIPAERREGTFSMAKRTETP